MWKWMNLRARNLTLNARLKARGKFRYAKRPERLPVYMEHLPKECIDIIIQKQKELDGEKERKAPLDVLKDKNIDTEKLVSHSLFSYLFEQSERIRINWYELASTTLIRNNFDLIWTFIRHQLVAKEINQENGLHWITPTFCRMLYQNYLTHFLSEDADEEFHLFLDLANLSDLIQLSGAKYLQETTNGDVQGFINNVSNDFVDEFPELYFHWNKFNLMTKGLTSNNENVKRLSSEYFNRPTVKTGVYPLIMKHINCPETRTTLCAFYNEKPSYLDTISPLIDFHYDGGSEVHKHHFSEKELNAKYKLQMQNELDGYIKVPREVPLKVSFPPGSSKIRSLLPTPDLADNILEKYRKTWALLLECEILEMDARVDEELEVGGASLQHQLWLLSLRSILNLICHNEEEYGMSFKEVAERFIRIFIDFKLHLYKNLQYTSSLPDGYYSEFLLLNIVQSKLMNENVSVCADMNPTNSYLCCAVKNFIDELYDAVYRVVRTHGSFAEAVEWYSSDEEYFVYANQGSSGIGTARYTLRLDNDGKVDEKYKLESAQTVYDYLVRLAASKYHFAPTVHLPMLVPPTNYKINNFGAFGGYLLRDVNIIKMGPKPSFKVPLDQTLATTKFYLDYPKQNMKPFVNAVEAYNSTPYKINQRVLDVFAKIYISGGSPTIAIPSNTFTSDTRYALKPQGYKMPSYVSIQNEELGLCATADMAVSYVKWLGDNVFWLVHGIDFRGRLYPLSPIVSYLSDDKNRALFLFANGSKLGGKQIDGRTGLDWLFIHLVNVSEVQKYCTREQALTVGKKLLPAILDSARRPLDGAGWWKSQKQPFQTLAACFEICNALESGNPEEYVSHLPVYQDGTSNGYQHWSALGRDRVGAIATNVVKDPEDDSPHDLYTVILKKCRLHWRSQLNDEMCSHEDKQLAKEALKVANRGAVKRPVMTIPYGVTKGGAMRQVEKEIAHRVDRAAVPEVSRYISQSVFGAVDEVFLNSMKIKSWLTDITGVHAELGNQMVWITPLGLPISQILYSTSLVHYTQGEQMELEVKTSSDSVKFGFHRRASVVLAKYGIAPNFVHSLDAAHAQLTNLYMSKNNHAFSSVHDSYWTRASEVAQLNYYLRKAFADMYQHDYPKNLVDLLENYSDKSGSYPAKFNLRKAAILQKMITDVEKRKTDLYKSIPPPGDIDINEVFDSKYFFC